MMIPDMLRGHLLPHNPSIPWLLVALFNCESEMNTKKHALRWLF